MNSTNSCRNARQLKKLGNESNGGEKMASPLLTRVVKVENKKTCHGCGLESTDDCPNKHTPAIDRSEEPCCWCVRNPQFRDCWDERWTLDENGKAFIEK
jgi:hypothetical protein